MKFGHSGGVDCPGVRIIAFLLFYIVHGTIASVGVFINFAVADTLETSGAGQSGAKTANTREHIKILNQSTLTSSHINQV